MGLSQVVVPEANQEIDGEQMKGDAYAKNGRKHGDSGPVGNIYRKKLRARQKVLDAGYMPCDCDCPYGEPPPLLEQEGHYWGRNPNESVAR
ncbi:MAG: hypothetical protein IH960_10600 [Chloroflexi bacterium]|nr:hypothetical protein [Chloroflexota bacterium]